MPRSLLLIPFLFNVAPVVWLSGLVVEVEELDQEAAASLERVLRGLQRMYSTVPFKGRINIRRLVANPKTCGDGPRGVLFSGGVDSVCTSLRYARERQILVTVQGADVSLRNAEGWALVKAKTAAYAGKFGHESLYIRSNLRDFLRASVVNWWRPEIPDWWENIQHGLGLVGVALPGLYAHGANGLEIASSRTINYRGGWGSHPTLDDEIAVAGIQVHHDAFELSRQEKVDSIVEASRRLGKKLILRVCLFDPTARMSNCGRCEKCLRTMNQLLLAGERDLRDYDFPLDAEEVMRRTYRSVCLHLLPVSSDNIATMWKNDIQAAARARRDVDGVLPEQAEYFAWLAKQDFDRYHRTHKMLKKPKAVVARGLRRFPPLLRFAEVAQLKVQGRFAKPSGLK